MSLRRERKRNHPTTAAFREEVKIFIRDTAAHPEIAYAIQQDLKKKTDMPFYGLPVQRVQRTLKPKALLKAYAELLLRHGNHAFSKQLLQALNRQQQQTIRNMAPKLGPKGHFWDHAIPTAVIIKEVISMLEFGSLDEIDRLLDMYQSAGQRGITAEENRALILCGLQSSMPAGWDWRSSDADPLARYKQANLSRLLSI